VVVYIIVGFAIGILIYYFIDVFPHSRKITHPVCSECNQPRRFLDYLRFWQMPQCGHGNPVSAVAIVGGSIIASTLVGYFPISGLSFWATLPLMIYLGVVLVIDIQHRLILTETSLLGMALCFVYGYFLNGILGTAFGGLGGFGIMLAFYLLGKLFSFIVGKLRHKKINEVAFGFGDIMLGGVLGLLTGWPAVIGIILIAILTFGAFSIVYLLVLVLTKRYKSFATALPFAPFMILGALIMLYI
jgi:prepilin signal peptidase PulO-like enzyme (type II secretory pathway)